MGMMKLRQFNESGIEMMNTFLDSIRTDTPLAYNADYLINDKYSEVISDVEIENKQFVNKFELSEYLHTILSETKRKNIMSDNGLWCWLSYLFFEQICPQKHGKFVPSKKWYYIPSNDYQTYYRHLLAGPYRIYYLYRDNPKIAMAFLCGKISAAGELHEQIASRQELITNKNLIEAINTLYHDANTGANRRGFGGSGGGSPRRLADIINQFSLTWDMYSMSAFEILELLPSEFDRFKNPEDRKKKNKNMISFVKNAITGSQNIFLFPIAL